MDLEDELKHGTFLRANGKLVKAATDLADGGLALAAFEMAEGAGLGLQLDAGDIATLFGEDQGRYLVACDADGADALEAAARAAGVPIDRVGTFGGDAVAFGSASAPMAELSKLYRTAFADAIGG